MSPVSTFDHQLTGTLIITSSGAVTNKTVSHRSLVLATCAIPVIVHMYLVYKLDRSVFNGAEQQQQEIHFDFGVFLA